MFSSIDAQGRYAYDNQPYIALWNLGRFAETLLPLLHAYPKEAIDLAQAAVSEFSDQYQHNWLAGMRAKLGLFNEESQDELLVEGLLGMMQKYRADHTNTFRALTFGSPEETVLFGNTEFTRWHDLWQARVDRQQESKASVRQLMQTRNPAVIPRNHRVEAALGAAVQQGDYSVLERLLEVLANPYAHSPEQSEYTEPPASSARPYRTFCGT